MTETRIRLSSVIKARTVAEVVAFFAHIINATQQLAKVNPRLSFLRLWVEGLEVLGG